MLAEVQAHQFIFLAYPQSPEALMRVNKIKLDSSPAETVNTPNAWTVNCRIPPP
jgi:hypothetical protein